MASEHSFNQISTPFRYSPLLQEMTVYVGQSSVYAKGHETLKRLLGIDVSCSSVNNITNHYGSLCGDETILLSPTLTPLVKDNVLYAEVDGMMLSTRDEGWKETKTGRLFKSSDCIDPNGNNSRIKHSQYYSYLGDSKTFTDKMDTIIDGYHPCSQQLVFITDGATWIKNWIADSFPQAIAILDYFHALEHLHEFKNNVFADNEADKAEKWVNEQRDLLLESKTEEVIANIGMCAGEGHKEAARKLINYYQANVDRMDYKHYKTIGAGIIGSGAIESAHKTLVQVRMKLSGQRWGDVGAQNVLNLRAIYLNGKDDIITRFCKGNTKMAA